MFKFPIAAAEKLSLCGDASPLVRLGPLVQIQGNFNSRKVYQFAGRDLPPLRGGGIRDEEVFFIQGSIAK